MCIAIPAVILELRETTAVVQYSGAEKRVVEVGRTLLPDACAGQWALVYAGQLQSLIPPEEVESLLKLMDELNAWSLQPPSFL